MTWPVGAKLEQLGQMNKHNIPKQAGGVKYQTHLSIMTTGTCQDHAVMFMATEQHLLIEIYGYFKHFVAKKDK